MLVKFALKNLLSDLKENKKNCLIIVGKEPIQICTVKDDINKSCQNDSIDKILIKVENGIDLNQLDHTFNNQSLCLLYTSPSPRDRQKSRMPSSA